MTAPDTDAQILDAMAASLESNLTKVFRLFRHQLLEEARAHGLTMAQYTTLRLLSDGTGRRMSDLADYLDLTGGAATALIEKLVERGLVARQEDPHDKRAVLVALSPAGLTFVAETKALQHRRLADRLATLSPAERYMVTGGIETLAASMRKPGDNTP
jgi:DNA-binding MarR family transcriptional regulator